MPGLPRSPRRTHARLPQARAAGLALLLLAACVTETRARFAHEGGPVAITRTEPARAWRLVEGGRPVALVVLFADSGGAEETSRHYFSVRNLLHQELGTVDALGRAWRFVPHEREARLLGAGTLAEGARRIVGAGPGAALEELPPSALRDPAGSPPAAPAPSAGAAPDPAGNKGTHPRPG